jgi:hypothetical protein
MGNKNLWIIHTKQDPIKGQLILRHIWKGTSNECRSLWRFNEDVVIGGTRQYTTLNGSFRDVYTSFKGQYLYVTSKEPYKTGDWVKNVTIDAEPPFKLDAHGIRYTLLAPCKFEKVVLTTDNYLIEDGIQSVEEEFLDWFCKNPSCEEVGVYFDLQQLDQTNPVLKGTTSLFSTYKIIIPKEENKQELPKTEIDWSRFPKSTQEQVGYVEPKQETLEEAYNKIYKSIDFTEFDFTSFAIGAKWQQEQNNTSKVTRVEVIQHLPPHIDTNSYAEGYNRAYTNYNAKEVEIQFQDDCRTLKIFLK